MAEATNNRGRATVLFLVIIVLTLAVLLKLFSIQVLDHGKFAAAAEEERWLQQSIPSDRGALLDSSGNLLAVSVMFDAVYADPARIGDVDKTAEALSPLLDLPIGVIRERLTAKQPSLIPLGLTVPATVASHLRTMGLPGIYLLPHPKRVYPEGNLASQTLGVVGHDNQGLSGIEAYLNEELRGQPGYILGEKDTAGLAIPLTIKEYVRPTRGQDLVLTIDRQVQAIAERELQKGLANSQAKSGTVVVMEPKTGAVLALASFPSFAFSDPALFSEATLALYNGAAISDAYEPGSVFKIVTMAAGLDSGAVTADEAYLNQGSLEYGGGVVHNPTYRAQGMETMTQVLERSSNIGAAYIAAKTGPTSFYRYTKTFGFGKPLGIEVVGEAAGTVRTPSDRMWNDFDLAANAFGQGISATPLQLAAATAAIANGGTLMRPTLLKEWRGSLGVSSVPPVVLQQAVKPSVAKAVTNMMVATVESTEGGNVRESRLPGYRLAGKSGTAEIPTAGGYRTDATITSFVGFGPADSPRFVIVVKLVEPQTNEWGEHVTAPVFREIAARLMAYYGIPPS